MNLYPLKFKPIYKEKIWGGKKFKEYFHRKIPAENTGESWEIAAHKNSISTVSNGPLAGKKLDNLISNWPGRMIGKEQKTMDSFPLLIKLLDASDKLSIQVHPHNNYAKLVSGESGKSEMWYILSAEPKAKLIYGFKKGTTCRDIRKAINSGNLEKYLNEISVKPGDTFYIPAGTVHGIGKGILLAEIQENSDTTYRLYDWNRTDKRGNKRPLHINKALEVINFDFSKHDFKNLIYDHENYRQNYLAACSSFAVEKINIKKEFFLNTEGNKFYIILSLKGNGKIYYHKDIFNFSSGESIFLPASLGAMKITGDSTFLLIYIPEKKEKFINKLINRGFPGSEIKKLPGLLYW